ncbi:MAG: MCE family protein [Deltaproteobacteria bacterium]|nr:MCE family protein [Deltaproteobacteria bacterium]
MPDRRRLNLIVGSFVVAALAVGAMAVLFLGARGGILNPRYRLVTYFDDVQGLVAGAPVRLAGRDIGSVEFVSFAPLAGDLPPVRVIMQVDEAVQNRVRSDSVARIATIGLLGDKYVEISMGTPVGRVLGDGEELASVSPLDLGMAVTRGTEAIDNIATLAENVNRVVEEFGASMGGKKVADATSSLTAIVAEIQEGDGLLHGLIYDSYEGGGVDSVERSLVSVADILDQIRNGEGTLHQLIYGGSEEGDVLKEALEVTARLNAILAKIDTGDGTLGLLVNDPGLYTDLQELVGGAQRSLVVRSLIRLSTEGE